MSLSMSLSANVIVIVTWKALPNHHDNKSVEHNYCNLFSKLAFITLCPNLFTSQGCHWPSLVLQTEIVPYLAITDVPLRTPGVGLNIRIICQFIIMKMTIKVLISGARHALYVIHVLAHISARTLCCGLLLCTLYFASYMGEWETSKSW